MKVAIGLVLYITNENHVRYIKETVKSIESKYHQVEILLFPNKIRPSDVEWLKDLPGSVFLLDSVDEPVSVAQAWNELIWKGLEGGNDYVIVPNTDIVFHPKCIDNLVKFADEHKEFVLWTAAEHEKLGTLEKANLEGFDEHPHFSCFMVSQRTIDKVGWFDHNFIAAYFEDGDYHNRILLTGNKAGKTGTARFFHYGSRTIKEDAELNKRNEKTYEHNRDYFFRKWGYDTHGVAYSPEDRMAISHKTPFNEPETLINDWGGLKEWLKKKEK